MSGAGGSVGVVDDALFDEGLFDVGGPGSRQEAAAPVVGLGAPGPSGSGSERLAANAPLAVRMRPRSLDEVVGQGHLLGPGAPLRRLVEGAAPASVLLYGPPGTGKTTLATLVSQATGRRFVALSALTAGVKEVRGVIEEARRRLVRSGEATVLFIDEVHRFSRTQQDALLGAVEDRVVLLVAATTENPFFSVVSPLLSRSLVLQLRPLTDDDVRALVRRALADERGLGGALTLEPDAEDHLVRLAGGDARRALTALEAAADAAASTEARVIDLPTLESTVDKAAVRYDRSGDQHYDVTSAFIKSIRGSDVDAALHYLARMIEAGEDPRFIARRLIVHASEDVGMADPTALQTAVAAAQAVQLVGLPEGRLALAQATIHLATAPKSNAVITAIDSAAADVRKGEAGTVPPHLRDGHYAGANRLGNAQGYRYPHNVPEGVVAQQYAPDGLVGRDYYRPTSRGAERVLADRVPKLRRMVRGEGSS
ncbi:Recombination protein MgsA [Streptoalloteichus tenebrarius]|uniref:Recombination protein MgsA n=1 Tax=Streptoalloteichus tenebrarius (strain ATCC 17920 / DSM 40477 / JCM 4838 / CBS 697.72 / NBRC 16177 / NCIMB 11028 / NRRL B-12390 / A12253. 1 / ISP 5477) TaxID=1933 RepID=A0ABT1HSL1_STRSD|nr:Recombination protein MgsA [Streptoalloteichus tenebrarius]BFF03580.1 replication-associated recombination protein A [Streptoalloteichus tenebrarius]